MLISLLFLLILFLVGHAVWVSLYSVFHLGHVAVSMAMFGLGVYLVYRLIRKYTA